MYIIGPNDTPEHVAFSKALEEALTKVVPRVPPQSMNAEEFAAYADLLPLAKSTLTSLVGWPRWQDFLNRTDHLELTIYVDQKGMQGILQYHLKVQLTPLVVSCTSTTGNIEMPRSFI